MPASPATSPSWILLTSFGAFPGVPDNVSDALVMALVKTWKVHQAADLPKPITALLAVDWQTAGGAVRDLYERRLPAVAVHFGVSDDADGLVLERLAFNQTDLYLDQAGHFPDSPVLKASGPDKRETRTDVATLATALQDRGHTVTVSTDPGRYLCNAVYFEALTCSAANTAMQQCLFVHIPERLDVETPAFTKTLHAAHDLIAYLCSNSNVTRPGA